jgi:hypothetical protein
VASFSTNRLSRPTQATGVSSPASSMMPRAYFEIGANGLSLTSLPATIGIDSSSRVVSARRMRDFAWPRRPSRMKLCRDRIALTICGMTVSSYPRTPANSGPPWQSLRMRF